MRFIVIRDTALEEIEFLRGRYRVVSSPYDEEVVYEAEEELRRDLEAFEKAGWIKEIKGITELRKAEDLIGMTKRVELVDGGEVYLRVHLKDTEFLFEESELLGPVALKRKLLRLRKAIQITGKEWNTVLSYWLSVAEKIKEESEEDVIRNRALNYLTNSVVYEKQEIATSPFTLYYNPTEPEYVYSEIESLLPRLAVKISRRKVRSILSEYITEEPLRVMIRGTRYRFWRFIIKKVGVDLGKQKYKEESEEGEKGEESKDEARKEVS